MPTEIDSLQIEISAKAQKANKAIDSLVGRLDVLSKSLGKINTSGNNISNLGAGVERLARGMQGFKGVGEAKFVKLANGINQLSNINVQGISNAARSLQQISSAFDRIGGMSGNTAQVADLAKNLGKLGNKNVANAITNIPQLATALNNLMATLSKAPTVSQNVIQMTNALANLSAQGSKVGSASNSIAKGLNRASNSTTRARKNFGGLASAIGKFYATYFLAIRGIKGLWRAIESTADYIEAFNYFNVALGKIGSDWSHQFEKYGYENAKAYADSFANRLSDSLKNLSGVTIEIGADGNGLLSATNLKNLGLNIQELTQYASQLASVTNAVGQTGESSLAISSTLTKLSGDISSLFNLDYSSVAKNFQSGIIGQSRALYKYGIDITNATLQTYAYELGLSKAVSEMTQAEKMQLRFLAILDQSKVAWGDLANTINSPSNMIRQFSNNLKESGMILGQLFIPMLQRVMPVLNGITIAFKNLLVNMASFFGIQLDLSSFGQGYSDLGDDVDGFADSLDDATASAKKLKSVTLGIDELNINAPQEDSGTASGVGGGIDLTDEILNASQEYEKAWSEAFANMESKAQQFAEKFDKIFAPIKNMAFHFSIGDFEAAGNDFSNLAIGIFSSLTRKLEEQDWSKVGEKIGQFLDGIDWGEIFKSGNNFFKTLVGAAVEAWKNSAEEAPLETIILTALGLSATSPAGMALLGKVGTAYITFVVSTEITKGVMTWLVPEDKEWYVNFKFIGDDEYSLSKVLAESFKDGTWKTALTEMFNEEAWISVIFPNFGNAVRSYDAFSDFAVWWDENIAPWFSTEKWMTMGSDAMVGITIAWYEFTMGYQKAVSDWWNKDVKTWFDKKKWQFEGVKDGLSAAWESAIESIKQIWNRFANWLNEKLTWEIEPIVIMGKTIFEGTTISLGKIPTFQTGGFPEDGLFMANHNELVGTFSNGKTAVANNEQIVSGITAGVREANAEEVMLLRQQNELLTRLLEKETTIAIGDRDIAKANIRGQKSLGYQLITV